MVFELSQANYLSPFNLVLRVLDEGNAQYSFYRAEFYKNNCQNLFKILDAISINGLGKLGRRMQQSQDLGIFCDIINDEMDAVKDIEKLPGLASITPEFMSDDLQQHRDSR